MKKGLLILSLIYVFQSTSWAQLNAPTLGLRLMAEWEETEYLCVSWAREFETLREIIRYAKEEA